MHELKKRVIVYWNGPLRTWLCRVQDETWFWVFFCALLIPRPVSALQGLLVI